MNRSMRLIHGQALDRAIANGSDLLLGKRVSGPQLHRRAPRSILHRPLNKRRNTEQRCENRHPETFTDARALLVHDISCMRHPNGYEVNRDRSA